MKMYEYGAICSICGCSPICVCHEDDGRGGCVKCGMCKSIEYKAESSKIKAVRIGTELIRGEVCICSYDDLNCLVHNPK